MNQRRVLVTGATGAVGAETLRHLRRIHGVDVVGVSAHGDVDDGVLSWRMGEAPPPDALRAPWDVIVHTAASTRWSMTPEEGMQANVASTAALAGLLDDRTHLVFTSTAHVEGWRGSVESDCLEDYRNVYEWSKAAGERLVADRFGPADIVRFPTVLGRRTDGHLDRYSGFYKILSAISSGLIPAIVAREDAPLDAVPVDDIAIAIVDLVQRGRPIQTTRTSIGRGALALTVAELLDLYFGALDEWRAERGVDAIPRPPVLTPERWERFFLPFSREHLTPLQLRAIDVFSDFRPYLSMPAPFGVTVEIDDISDAVRRTTRSWASKNERAAARVPVAWG